jgi:hypothetical protein
VTTNPLLEKLIQTKNLSGAIPAAPHGMKDLTEAIKKLPFDVGTPAMSTLLNGSNMMSGVSALASLLGGLAGLGGLVSQVIGQAAKQSGVQGQLNSNTATSMASSVDTSKLVEALGPAQALIASLNPLKG